MSAPRRSPPRSPSSRLWRSPPGCPRPGRRTPASARSARRCRPPWSWRSPSWPRPTTARGRARPAPRAGSLLQPLGLRFHVLDPADHVERLLGQVVVLALADRLERGNGFLERREHAGLPGELLGHVHRLGQEPLDPPCSLHGDLVLLAELVDAEDGDDVLQLLVPLQDPLHLAGHVVVVLTDVPGVQDP